jgi:DNA-binding Lrp family transcriptional regulator
MNARMPTHAGPDAESTAIDAVDRAIIVATQAGLPLEPRPYHAVAAQLQIAPEELMARMRRMLEAGIIRRIAAVPNHYAVGYRANGMSVWDVEDDAIEVLGPKVGALAFVSHSYRRPRQLPAWRYNLFAMVHGATREEVGVHVSEIAALLGASCRAHDVLFSTRILKKTGMRLATT